MNVCECVGPCASRRKQLWISKRRLWQPTSSTHLIGTSLFLSPGAMLISVSSCRFARLVWSTVNARFRRLLLGCAVVSVALPLIPVEAEIDARREHGSERGEHDRLAAAKRSLRVSWALFERGTQGDGSGQRKSCVLCRSIIAGDFNQSFTLMSATPTPASVPGSNIYNTISFISVRVP